MDTRIAAATVLTAVLRHGQSLTQALSRVNDKVAARDQGLLQELCFGVARYAPRYEVLADNLLSKPIKSKETEIKALLFLGFYQLEHTRIPDHAAINSVVEATKKLKKSWATGLLNATLRRFNRERALADETAAPVAASYQSDPQFLYAHPQWLINMLRKAWPNDWQALLTANNQHPPLTLRINQQRISRADYSAQFDHPHRLNNLSRQALTLNKAGDITGFPGYHEGWFAVQDEAAQLCADLLDLKPQQRVLDACCAPGGKTCHILEQQPALAELVALDVDAQRMARVEQNLTRLGLQATLKVADAGDTASWWDGQPFERILLDAPCSATGVIRRHPDIKLLRRADDIAKLAQLQQALLAALWPTLAAGGRLLYATCSVLPRENEKSVQQFLADTPDAVHTPITDVAWGTERPFGRQLFPQEHGHDGFYYCILSKQV
ncbi:MAG TPA: 16S rRNA (cytosine(967)-C(5))-methyltransferase RsmB [Marinagarivorans sp.]